MLLSGYTELQYIVPTFIQPTSEVDSHLPKMLIASLTFDKDISALFPYINASYDDAIFYDQPLHVRLLIDGYRCLLYARTVVAYYFEGKKEAEAFAAQVVDLLNRMDDRKDDIIPSYDQVKRIPIMDIMKVLPKTNCGTCGYPTCMAFAAALMRGKATTESCHSLTSPMHENAVYPIFDDHGRIENTLSLKINTSGLKETIKAQQDRIVMLEASLKSYQQDNDEPNRRASIQDQILDLTARELEVLRLMAEGFTNNEISRTLFISTHTVKSHMINIFNKLCVNDRTKAAVVAIRKGLI